MKTAEQEQHSKQRMQRLIEQLRAPVVLKAGHWAWRCKSEGTNFISLPALMQNSIASSLTRRNCAHAQPKKRQTHRLVANATEGQECSHLHSVGVSDALARRHVQKQPKPSVGREVLVIC